MKINLHLLSKKQKTIYKFYKLDILNNGKPMKKMAQDLVFRPIFVPYLINDFLHGYLEKYKLSKWDNYVEGDEECLLQFNIVMSLVSYPNQNKFDENIWLNNDSTLRCFLADGDYDPHTTRMPTQHWRELSQFKLKVGSNSV